MAKKKVVVKEPVKVVVKGDPDTPPTWLYKGKDSQIFEGVAVAEALSNGWSDTKTKG